ncbi:MAG: acetyltransferase [Gemmatimonadetes bacterium]|nr:acetyltransferase [Gemmatimonadota bacterium]
MSAPPLVILGWGGHARECGWIARQCADGGPREVVAFAVDDGTEGRTVDGLPVLALGDAARRFPGARFISGLGSPNLRRSLAEQALALGMAPDTLIHPGALVAPDASVGEGSVLFPGTVVSCGVRIGAHVHVNTGSSVSHDCVLEAYATLSPGVMVGGNVHVGAGALLGIGASVAQGQVGAPLRIGPWAVVGAGACVLRPVADASVVAGVPARLLAARERDS